MLDDAALRIVRTAALFAPFTGELAQKYDQVEIIRTALRTRRPAVEPLKRTRDQRSQL